MKNRMGRDSDFIDTKFIFCSSVSLGRTHDEQISQNFRCCDKNGSVNGSVANDGHRSIVFHYPPSGFSDANIERSDDWRGNYTIKLSWPTTLFEYHPTFWISFIPFKHIRTCHTVFSMHSWHSGMNSSFWHSFNSPNMH